MLSFEQRYWLAHNKDFDVLFFPNGRMGLTFYPPHRVLRFSIEKVSSMIELVNQIENFAYTQAKLFDQMYLLDIVKRIPTQSN